MHRRLCIAMAIPARTVPRRLNNWEFGGAGMNSSDGPNSVLGVELAREELTRRGLHRVQES